MGAELLSEKYADKLDGVLHCFDRVVLTGSLQPLCYAQGMTGYLYGQGIRVFDYANFSQPLREQICAHAEALAQANGLEIEYIRKKDFRKEDRIRDILKQRGEQPGLVYIFSALEPCPSYRPLHANDHWAPTAQREERCQWQYPRLSSHRTEILNLSMHRRRRVA